MIGHRQLRRGHRCDVSRGLVQEPPDQDGRQDEVRTRAEGESRPSARQASCGYDPSIISWHLTGGTLRPAETRTARKFVMSSRARLTHRTACALCRRQAVPISTRDCIRRTRASTSASWNVRAWPKASRSTGCREVGERGGGDAMSDELAARSDHQPTDATISISSSASGRSRIASSPTRSSRGRTPGGGRSSRRRPRFSRSSVDSGTPTPTRRPISPVTLDSTALRCACSTPRPGFGGSGGLRRSGAASLTRRSSVASGMARASSSVTTFSTDGRPKCGSTGRTSRHPRHGGISPSRSTTAGRSIRTGSWSSVAHRSNEQHCCAEPSARRGPLTQRDARMRRNEQVKRSPREREEGREAAAVGTRGVRLGTSSAGSAPHRGAGERPEDACGAHLLGYAL